MSLNHETIIVEKVTQWGVRSGGMNYGLSPKLKDKGVTPEIFKEGVTYSVEVWTGPKGGKSINAYNELGASQPIAPPVAAMAPSLPQTTVASTPAPGGIAPIAPAKKEPTKDSSDEDKMSKADWADKDRRIGIDAVLKSTFESPALAQLVVGKNQQEAFLTTREFAKYNLETQRMAKEGVL
jgi:hypothetical protein